MSIEQDVAAKKTLVADWFGRSAAVYLSPFFSYPGHRLVELAGVRPGAQVLDVCTGTGAVLIPAVQAVGDAGHVTGIDFADEMVQEVSNGITRKGLANADARQMDAEQLDFPDASCDYVLVGFGINFLPRQQQALAEMKRVLKPGGVLAVSTWGEGNELAGRYGQLAKDFNVIQPDLESHHLGTQESLKAVFLEAGCPDVQVTAEMVKVIFDNKQEYWAQRMPVEQVALEDLNPRGADFRRAVYALLEDYLYVDGVHETRDVLYAAATVQK